MKKWKVKTLTVLTGLWRSSWCALQGLEGCPSGGKVLLSLKQFGALHLQLPISKSIESKYPVKPQGGDGAKEGSPGPSDESDHAQNPPGGGPQGVGQCTQTPFLNPDPF